MLFPLCFGESTTQEVPRLLPGAAAASLAERSFLPGVCWALEFKGAGCQAPLHPARPALGPGSLACPCQRGHVRGHLPGADGWEPARANQAEHGLEPGQQTAGSAHKRRSAQGAAVKPPGRELGQSVLMGEDQAGTALGGGLWQVPGSAAWPPVEQRAPRLRPRAPAPAELPPRRECLAAWGLH